MEEGAETKMIVGVPSQTDVIYPITTVVSSPSRSSQNDEDNNSDYCTWKFFAVSTANREIEK